MLTLDLDRLGVRSGHVVLDLGCGLGRHTFEALRRGAHVVACDLDADALREVTAMVGAMRAEGEVSDATRFAAVVGDARSLPFSNDDFDHVIASEMLEHIPEDDTAIAEIARVTRPRGTVGVSVPRSWPEHVCWALSDEYHESAGGHVRIYGDDELVGKLGLHGLEALGRHHAHSLHSPYWWLKCAFGVDNESARVPGVYHRFLVWQITTRPAPVDRLERLLDPILGKSLVLYAHKDGVTRA